MVTPADGEDEEDKEKFQIRESFEEKKVSDLGRENRLVLISSASRPDVTDNAVSQASQVSADESSSIIHTPVDGSEHDRIQGRDYDRAVESGKSLSCRIPKDMRGIPIPVNKLTGLFGYLTPGDRVDVLVSTTDKNNSGLPSAYTAAKNAIVLSVGDAANEKEDGKSQTVVILAVTSEQAEALAGAYQTGVFHLLLCPGG
ncbi:MAG: Flp pilus assembly protein CpaB [Bacillota bacterium]|nr:Flp pilus assembly protein CpaB [Bacillota bacterium]